MSEKIKTALKTHGLDGILLILAGLIMLIWPEASLKILCIVMGIILIIIGGINLLSYFFNKYAEVNKNALIYSTVAVILGILMIVLSRFFVSVFLVIVGLLLLFGCFMLFRRAYQLRDVKDKDFIISLVLGIVILILGIVMIINPVGTGSFVVRLIGIALIIMGIAALVMFRNRME